MSTHNRYGIFICVLSIFCFFIISCQTTDQPTQTDNTTNPTAEQYIASSQKKKSESLKLYENAVVELKHSMGNKPEEFNEKINKLRSKYNVKLMDPENIPSSKRPLPEKDNAPINLSKTTARTAAAYEHTVDRKDITYTIRRPYHISYYVQPGNQIWVKADAVDGSDPFAIIYKCTANCYSYQQGELDVLDYNDDWSGGDLSSYASWTNNTGSAQGVYVFVFPYDEYSQGLADIVVKNGSQTFWDWDEPLVGVRVTANSGWKYGCDGSWGNDPCPNHIYGEFQPDDPGYLATTNWECASSNGDSYLWVFNFTTMKGLRNDDYSGTAATIYHVPVWPESPNMPNHLFILGGYSDGGTARFLQADPYWCHD
jgi:hypothetical protein